MNCLEARRILTATPETPDEAVRGHLQRCPACARHARAERDFERQLRAQLRAVMPPPELVPRILLQHGLRQERRQQRRQRYWQALAASVLLTLGLVSGMLMVNSPWSLEEVALAHVRNEPRALQAQNDIGLARINTLLAPYHLKLEQAIGRVEFAMPCYIRRYAGAHLVLAGEQGKVTVLLMPGEYVMARKTLREPDLQAVLIPVDGGSVAIIGSRQEPLGAVEARLRQALRHTA